VNLGGRKIAWLQSYNFSDFGDMKMGDNYPDQYPNYGRRTEYIAFINGLDSVVKNSDDRVQRYSGYKQWDITQKLLWNASGNISHNLQFQLSNSSNVPRYDRLQDRRNGTLRFAEWYYGPQKRILGAYQLDVLRAGIFDAFKLIASYQKIRESRHQREYRKYDRLDNRIEDVSVYAATADARKLWKQNELTVGIDAQLNDVHSSAFRKNVQTNAVSKLDSRYPNGTNKMTYVGFYAQHLLKLTMVFGYRVFCCIRPLRTIRFSIFLSRRSNRIRLR
jgi:hemoglobin/transferrin/lactoferrin receptor protein